MSKLEELKEISEWLKTNPNKTATDRWGRMWRFSERGYEVFLSGRKWTGFQRGALHKECLPFHVPPPEDGK